MMRKQPLDRPIGNGGTRRAYDTLSDAAAEGWVRRHTSGLEVNTIPTRFAHAYFDLLYPGWRESVVLCSHQGGGSWGSCVKKKISLRVVEHAICSIFMSASLWSMAPSEAPWCCDSLACMCHI